MNLDNFLGKIAEIMEKGDNYILTKYGIMSQLSAIK